ncbi:pentatricopeptide repeat-containing protein At4g14190, chloroplastic-like [Bidens hawaiensis]|uniref:pentatricopeptide repeat-containing protein At4g14190, chloroplastic-like n=1 Tax=Bidens hawaiensis TaxID=980011 RepID=UPI00404A8B4F
MEILLPSITINDSIFLCKTLIFVKPSARNQSTTKPQFSRSHKPLKTISDKQKTVQFDDLNRNWHLKRTLFEKLNHKDSDPVRVLEADGDWTKELFWAVVGFLNQTSRSSQVLKVFDKWSSRDESRASVFNYERIVRLLVDEGLVDVAVLALEDMKSIHGMQPSSEIYSLVIRGFIEKGRFEDALSHLKVMEDNDMKPYTSVYNGLIKSYAKNGLYDEMAKCVKRMESNGCFPDQSTYNLLIKEFSFAGLIKMMERTYRIVVSKKMDLEGSTVVAMLEAYANFGDLEKMEKVYRTILRLKPRVYLKDDLVHKVASVYIENYMFSKLDDMGINLYSRTGNSNVVWCLRMLSHACLLSRTGMESIVREMDYRKAKWSVTIANTMLFAYAKMKDFRHFKGVILEMAARDVKPDIVTYGILYDAHGFDELDYWRKRGFFMDVVELKTDPLVLVAFGKGNFLKIVEEVDHTKSQIWSYEHLIDLVKLRQQCI